MNYLLYKQVHTLYIYIYGFFKNIGWSPSYGNANDKILENHQMKQGTAFLIVCLRHGLAGHDMLTLWNEHGYLLNKEHRWYTAAMSYFHILSNKLLRSCTTKMPSQNKTHFSRRMCLFEDHSGQLIILHEWDGLLRFAPRMWTNSETNRGRKDGIFSQTLRSDWDGWLLRKPSWEYLIQHGNQTWQSNIARLVGCNWPFIGDCLWQDFQVSCPIGRCPEISGGTPKSSSILLDVPWNQSSSYWEPQFWETHRYHRL